MDIRLGYLYYSKGRNTNNHILLTFENNQLFFRAFPTHLLYQDHISTNHLFHHNYSIKHPVVFAEDSSKNIHAVKLLDELPIRFCGEITGNGLELSISFWRNSIWGSTKVASGILISDELSSPNILYNNHELFNLHYDKDSFSSGNDSKQCLFNIFVITHFAIKVIIDKIEKAEYRFPINRHYRQSRERNDILSKLVTATKLYIDSISLDDILSDLTIDVTYIHGWTTGDDKKEWSDYIRNAAVSSLIANNDTYLKHLIGIGQYRRFITIYNDDSDSTNPSLFLEDSNGSIITGTYTSELLERERQRIRSQYSKEMHISSIFMDEFSTYLKSSSEKNKWVYLLNEYYNILVNCFHIDQIIYSDHDSAKWNRFKDYGEQRFGPRIMTGFRNIVYGGSPSNPPQASIDRINDSIREQTMCTIPDDIFRQLERLHYFSTATSNYHSGI